MSFDLAVWEGPRPATDEEAAEVHERLMEQLESDESQPPTPAIASYVAALTARWPDLDAPGGEDSPWSVGPLISDASGGVITFGCVWSRADEVAEVASRIAAEHGLVCFDPQSEQLLPRLAAKRGWRRLFS